MAKKKAKKTRGGAKKQSGKAAAKQAAAAKELERERVLKGLVRRAMFLEDLKTPRDVLVDFAPFRRFQSAGFDATVDCYAAATLPPALLRGCFDLLKANMQSMYDATEGWGWKDKKKLAELTDSEARFLVVTTPPAAPTHDEPGQQLGQSPAAEAEDSERGSTPIAASASAAAASTGTSARGESPVGPGDAAKAGLSGAAGARETRAQNVCAFVHFRFCLEGVCPVLYVWEIQVGPSARRRGLGKRLAQICELVARKHGMEWVMLTVFTANTPAIKFYESLGYEPDETSPCMVPGADGPSNYEIYSKSLQPRAVTKQDEAAPIFQPQPGCAGDDLD